MTLAFQDQMIFQKEAMEVTDIIDTSVDVMNSAMDFMKETKPIDRDDTETDLRLLLIESEISGLMTVMVNKSKEQEYCGLILMATRASLDMFLDGVKALPEQPKATQLMLIGSDMIRISIFHLKAALEYTCGDTEKGSAMLEEAGRMAQECATRSQQRLDAF